MKYSQEIEINLPREEVIKLFDNPDNMQKWQPELISFEPISGNPGEEGARSRLKYKMGKREIEMIETITKRNLPREFNGTYEANGVLNIISNKFIDISESKTRWTAENLQQLFDNTENEFQLKGFMKLMGIFMPGSFKKQSYKYMIQFKEFAESALK